MLDPLIRIRILKPSKAKPPQMGVSTCSVSDVIVPPILRERDRVSFNRRNTVRACRWPNVNLSSGPRYLYLQKTGCCAII